MSRLRYVTIALSLPALLMVLMTLPGYVLVERYVDRAERVMNVRVVPVEFRLGFIDEFVRRRVVGDVPLVLVLGDSQAFGHRQKASDVYSALLARAMPGYRVRNVAVVGGQFADLELIIDVLERHHVRAALAIYNVNPSNFGVAARGEAFLLGNSIEPMGFIDFLTRNPGLTIDLFEEFHGESPSDAFRMVALKPDRYVDGGAEPYIGFERFLARLEAVSERAVVFIAPQALEAFPAYGYDVGAVESAMGRALDICRKHQTFVCLDLLGALPKDAFFDITHLNRRGHEQLARMLVAEIERARLLP